MRLETTYATSDARRAKLRTALQTKRCLRVLETHSPISALLAEHAHCLNSDGSEARYDQDVLDQVRAASIARNGEVSPDELASISHRTVVPREVLPS